MNMWLEELKSLLFWKAVAAEFIGTGFLVFLGCGAAVTSDPAQSEDAFVTRVAFTFGLTVATMVWCIGAASPGHINPAVTLGFLLTGKVGLLRAVSYIGAQCLGAMAGAGLLAASTTKAIREGSFGCNAVSADITAGQAVLIEALMTFVLVFTVLATCDTKRRDLNGSGPLAIGIAVLICHLAAIPLTGSSINPARSLGPAVVRGGACWTNHWVYWVGPLVGGAIGGPLYEFIFAPDASLRKLKQSVVSIGGGSSQTYDPLVDPLDENERRSLIN
ncbi:putative Aquaporin-4 [Hypsibius exemplaris]|uniref:Aquaporin-4 n=1 Tax=Hypsibius exemplaris TaxID=2072580 RepID=A0A1W0WEF6_HYPEX|nr:putative Aquaporin-4 [Hypsibius exemplaris]